ncbi:hypothetical protein E4K10_00075 [Streptomyces sp. T1317-0309]|nr:hypothetical protein E4K10_00075 [Streptomyces sp. T1317-0309]
MRRRWPPSRTGSCTRSPRPGRSATIMCCSSPPRMPPRRPSGARLCAARGRRERRGALRHRAGRRAGEPTHRGRCAVHGIRSYGHQHGAVQLADVDNAAGTAAAIDHLVAAGHRRIGLLGWPEGSSVGDARARGWLTAMDRHGLLAGSHRLDVRGADTTSSGTRLMAELLDRPGPPTAVVRRPTPLRWGPFTLCATAGSSLVGTSPWWASTIPRATALG